MKLDSKTASFYYSRPSEWLGGRRAVVPCAHILVCIPYTEYLGQYTDDTVLPGWWI